MDEISLRLEPIPPKSPWLRRWLWRFGFLTVLLLILLGFAPYIVWQSSLRDWVLAKATADIHGSVKIGGARLCWFSEPVLTDVELLDESGKKILSAPKVQMSRTLLGLALVNSDLGTITLEQPTIEIACADDSTNIEKALDYYINGPSSGPTRTAVHVVIQNGKLTLRDLDAGKAWTAENVVGDVQIPADRKTAMQLTCHGDMVDQAPDSKLDLNIAYRTGPGGANLPPMLQTEVKADSAPLAIVATLMHRFEPGLKSDGLVSGELKIAWNDQDPDAPVLSLEGHVTGRDLLVADPQLSAEPVALKSLDLRCKLTYSAGKIAAEDTRLTCDFGSANLTGSIDLAHDPFAALQTPGIVVACDLDLAGLSRLLSKPMHLQDGTKITGGRLSGSIRSVADKDSVAWSGRLQATGLRGVHQAQAIAWDNPVSLDFAAHNTPGSLPRIDTFKLVSEFGQFDVSGDGQKLAIGGNFDIGLFGKRLGQFVQLGTVQPTGRAAGQVTLQRGRGGAFSLKGEAQLSNLAVALGSGELHEDALVLRADGNGKVASEGLRLESAGVHFVAGSDNIDITLLEPVTDLRTLSGGYFQLGVRGDLARLQSLLSPVVALPPTLRVAGTAEAGAKVRFNAKTIDADSAIVNLGNARLVGVGLNIAEPQITFKPGTISWDRSTGKIEVQQAVLQSAALAVQTSALTVELASPKGLIASGAGTLRGDAARLQQWLPALTTEKLGGMVDGSFRFDLEGGAFKGDVDLGVKNLILGDPKNPIWIEPSLKLIAKGQFDPAAEFVGLDEFKLDATAIGCSASGRVAKLSTSRDLVLNGQLSYDLDKWTPQLRHLLGKDARLSGHDRRPFHLEGSLAPLAQAAPGSAVASPLAGLKGEIGVGWQSAKMHGCEVGPSEVKATMYGDGWVRIHVNDTTFNQGKLQLEPYIRLTQTPALLAFGKATGIQKARITPEMASSALGYIAPIFWGVRDSDGEVSVEIVPNSYTQLADTNKGDINGKIIIHSAKIAPGPLMQELAVLFNSKPDLTLPHEMVVPFRMYNGRIYHQNVDWPLGEMTVRTSGSVGFDGSLSMFVDMPVPQKWLPKGAPKSLQTIRLPIGGTVSQPHLDENAMKQEMAKYVEHAAENAIKNKFEKAFEGFIQPPKK